MLRSLAMLFIFWLEMILWKPVFCKDALAPKVSHNSFVFETLNKKEG